MCQQDCFKTDTPLLKQRAILLEADVFECICTFWCLFSCSLTSAVNYQALDMLNKFPFDYDQMRERKKLGRKGT